MDEWFFLETSFLITYCRNPCWKCWHIKEKLKKIVIFLVLRHTQKQILREVTDTTSPFNSQFSESDFKLVHPSMCQQDGQGHRRTKRTPEYRPLKEQQCVGDPWHNKRTRSEGCLKRKKCCEALQHSTLKCLIGTFWGNIKNGGCDCFL